MRNLLRRARGYAKGVGIPVAAALLVRATLVQAYHIPSGSMEDTLYPGDFVLAEKVSFGPRVPGRLPGFALGVPSIRLRGLRSPRPGDLVIFEHPNDPAVDLVKRCVAVAGQTIELRDKQLFVDGQPVSMPLHSKHADYRTIASRDRFGPYVVPPGHFFALGDNRDNSFDSRFFGAVPVANVRARPLAVYFSWNRHGAPGAKIRWAHLGGLH